MSAVRVRAFCSARDKVSPRDEPLRVELEPPRLRDDEPSREREERGASSRSSRRRLTPFTLGVLCL